MKPLFDSITRTVVPVIVGSALTLLVTLGLTPDPAFQDALSSALFALFTSAYYIVARLLETKVAPKFGWLLGLPKAPEYSTSDKEG